MPDFLSNFSNDSYQPNDNHEDEKIVEEFDEETETNDATEKSVEEESQNDKVVKTTSNKIQKREDKGAFASENLVVDTNYHKYGFYKRVLYAVCVLICILGMITLNHFTNMEEVPELVGQSRVKADTWAEDFKIDYDLTEVYSTEYAAGIVMEQEVPAGEKFNSSKLFSLTVSLGPDQTTSVEIPDFTNKTKDDIIAFIDENHMVNARVSEVDSTVPAGKYINSEFDEGVDESNYTIGDTVTFLVSKGPKNEQQTYVAEDFTFKSLDELTAWVAEKPLTISYDYEASNDIPENYIISQSIKAGDKLNYGDKIDVVVSKGSGESMVSFAGLNMQDANDLAIKNNITMQTSEVYSSSPAGSFISQSIAPGASYFEDDTVIVKYSLGQPYIEDFRGLPYNNLVDIISQYNQQGANIAYEVKEVENDELGKGQIVKQSVYGQYVAPGTHIKIEVAK